MKKDDAFLKNKHGLDGPRDVSDLYAAEREFLSAKAARDAKVQPVKPAPKKTA